MNPNDQNQIYENHLCFSNISSYLKTIQEVIQMMQSPLSQFRKTAAAIRENRRNLQPIHSPGISNEDFEQRTEDSPSDESNDEIYEELDSH